MRFSKEADGAVPSDAAVSMKRLAATARYSEIKALILMVMIFVVFLSFILAFVSFVRMTFEKLPRCIGCDKIEIAFSCLENFSLLPWCLKLVDSRINQPTSIQYFWKTKRKRST